MDAAQAAKLRAEFAPESIGKLPRITCKACSDKNCQQHQRQRCAACGNYISTQHLHLDYVGHAAVTDRLLQVDPDWTWEPAGLDERGLPAFDAKGGLWIKLTVAGVTRLGYGHGGTGFEPGDDTKKAIGDALRNAAMRFGVALDLWAKEDLKAEASGDPSAHSSDTAPPPFVGAPAAGQSPESSGDEASRTGTSPDVGQEPGNLPREVAAPAPADSSAKLTADRAKALAAALGGQKPALDLARDNWSNISGLRQLTERQAQELLEIAGKVPA